MVRGLLTPWLLLSANLVLAQVSVELDRNEVRVDESFGVYFTYEGDADVDPDFGELEKDFDIIGSNRQSTLQIINGRALSRQSWALTLVPERAGRLQIPSVRFADVESDPVEVVVEGLDGEDSGGVAEVFIEVGLEPDTVYVQQESLFTVRLFLAVPVSNATLTEPEVGAGDAVIEKLGDGRSYDATRDGRDYTVVERRYTIYPQRSGAVRIDPVVFSGEARSRSVAGRYRRVRSEPLALTVRSVPPNVDASRWLPARELSLRESWSEEPPEFRVGAPVTRTVTLEADGLTAAQLPRIPAAVPEEVRVYPDQPVLENRSGEGLTGTRIEKSALVPTRPGSFRLPAIEIEWWNTRAERLETARIPEREIQVLPVAGSLADATAAADSAAARAPGAVSGGAGFWPWVSLGLALAWLATLGLWFVTRRSSQHPKREDADDGAVSVRAARRALRKACRDRDPRAARQALLDWSRACKRQTDKTFHKADVSAELRDEIERLDRLVYGPESESLLHWDGSRLWELFEQDRKSATDRDRAREPSLAPLHY